jgi:hypothetical protein
MNTESRNSLKRKVVNCMEIADKHISTATKTRSSMNNARAIARQEPA